MNTKSSHFGICRRKQQKTQYLKEKNNILWTQITTRLMSFSGNQQKKRTSLLGKVQPTDDLMAPWQKNGSFTLSANPVFHFHFQEVEARTVMYNVKSEPKKNFSEKIWVFPKIGVPKMDGENNGKP